MVFRASAICFVAFVAFGLVIAASRRFADGPDRRRLTNAFLFFVLFVSFASGLTQHDMWPFSSWKMMTGLAPPVTRVHPTLRIVGVDASGNEHDIDYRAWQPLSGPEPGLNLLAVGLLVEPSRMAGRAGARFVVDLVYGSQH